MAACIRPSSPTRTRSSRCSHPRSPSFSPASDRAGRCPPPRPCAASARARWQCSTRQTVGPGPPQACGCSLTPARDQLAFNAGLQLAPVGVGLLMRNLDVICSFAWQARLMLTRAIPLSPSPALPRHASVRRAQVALFGEPAAPSSLAGAALIISGAAGAALSKGAACARRSGAAPFKRMVSMQPSTPWGPSLDNVMMKPTGTGAPLVELSRAEDFKHRQTNGNRA